MSLPTIKIESNIEKWKGYIEIYNPIPLVKLGEFDEAFKRAVTKDEKIKTIASLAELIPAVIDCVAVWKIEGLPEDVTPENLGVSIGVSRVDVARLVNWVANNILKLSQGLDPNA